MAGIVNSVSNIYKDLTSGKCRENFKNMTGFGQFKTVLKVAGVALAAGIIAGLLGGFGGGIFGLVAGAVVLGTVSVAAFAYCTSEHKLGEQIAALSKKCAANVKEAL